MINTNYPCIYRVQVLERAFSLLDVLDQHGSDLGLPDFSQKLCLHKSTVHRLLVVLEGHRYVEKDAVSGKYRLGSRLLELGAKVAANLDLSAVAKPLLEQLVHETGETAHLGVLRQCDVISIANVESSRTLQTPATVGRRSPAHCSSLGKCLLTALSDAELVDFAQTCGLKAYTPVTITRLDVLRAELRRVRERGFAVDDEEFEEGLKCIAAPVRDYSGKVIAAVSVAGPATRLSELRMPALSGSVMRAAAGLSAALGYQSGRESR